MEPQIGDKIEVVHNDSSKFCGVLFPGLGNLVQIKLDNGYNIAFDKKDIKKISMVKKMEKPKMNSSKKQPLAEPEIWVLHTGGTIASKVDYKTGGVVTLYDPEELLSMYPKLREVASISSKSVLNVMSENLDFLDYNKIADEINNVVKNSKKIKGIIITIGTDTMHYTACGLSFILENLNLPVILAGAQRSSDRGSSDAYENLINAAYFIKKTDYAGVGICMHENSDDENCFILHPHNTLKMHTSRRDTFRPVNRKPIARVNFKNELVEYLSSYNKKDGKELQLKPFNGKIKVGVIKSRPGITPEEIECFEKYDAVVIEGTGLGHFNFSKTETRKKLVSLAKKIPVILTSQCIYGMKNMKVYSPGRELIDMGILGDNAMLTFETTYIKTAWLLSNFSKEKFSELFDKNFRGEMITRIEEDCFLY